MSITIYGASDDLIEVDGDISEEFPLKDDDGGDLLAFSEGTILRVTYTRAGIWRIAPVVRGTADLTIWQCPEDDGGPDSEYSDKATLSGAAWVVHGVAHATVRD